MHRLSLAALVLSVAGLGCRNDSPPAFDPFMQRHLVPPPQLQGAIPATAPYYAAPPTVTPGMPASPPSTWSAPPTTLTTPPTSPLPAPAFAPSAPLAPPPIGTVRPASFVAAPATSVPAGITVGVPNGAVAVPGQPGVTTVPAEPRPLPPPPAKWLSPAEAPAAKTASLEVPKSPVKAPGTAPKKSTDLDHAANLEWSSPGQASAITGAN
jgi:hypothetical protein